MDIVICARTEVGAALAHSDFEHIISIGDTFDPPPPSIDCDDSMVLRLEFADTAPFEDDPDGPQEEHVEALLEYGLRIVAADRTLIHCAEGISRSSASALILLAMDAAPGAEGETVGDLMRLPGGHRARPNTRMIELADDLMERNGDLIGALIQAYYS